VSKQTTRRLAMLALLAMAAACSTSRSAHRSPTSVGTTASFVFDRALAQHNLETLVQVSPGTTAAILAVSVHGDPPTILTTGRARPNDAFYIASVSKTFVGALVLVLADRRVIALDDPINHYGVNFPRGDTITVRELLDHTSGIPPLGDDTGTGAGPYAGALASLLARHPGHRFTDTEILASVAHRPLLHSPGTTTTYSNIDTILAGRIVELVTHEPLARALHRYLLDPLHLSSTRYVAEEARPPRTIPLPAASVSLSTALGASGDMVSNAPDLVAWANAFLRKGSFLSPTMRHLATTIEPGGTGAGTVAWGAPVGMCVFTASGCPKHGVRFFAYGGSGNVPGAHAMVLYDRDNDAVLVAYANGASAPVNVLAPLTWFHRRYRTG
jgi:D-alanyl-D-alanine carboxypeptidase